MTESLTICKRPASGIEPFMDLSTNVCIKMFFSDLIDFLFVKFTINLNNPECKKEGLFVIVILNCAQKQNLKSSFLSAQTIVQTELSSSVPGPIPGSRSGPGPVNGRL